MVFQLGVTTFNAKVEKSLEVTLKRGIIRVVISLSSEGEVILTTEGDGLDNLLDLLPIIVDLPLHQLVQLLIDWDCCSRHVGHETYHGNHREIMRFALFG